MTSAVSGNFRFVDETVRVQIDSDPVGLTWLGEFVEPWFVADHSGRFGTTVSVAIDPQIDDRIARTLAAANDEAVCVLLDRGPVVFPAVRSGDAWSVADVDRGFVFEVDGESITIFGPAGTRRHRFFLLRVLREVLAGRVRAQPEMLDLHAAAIGTGVGGVVICGHRRAGKTTTTCRALAAGASLISNDRVLVDMSASTPVVLPTSSTTGW